MRLDTTSQTDAPVRKLAVVVTVLGVSCSGAITGGLFTDPVPPGRGVPSSNGANGSLPGSTTLPAAKGPAFSATARRLTVAELKSALTAALEFSGAGAAALPAEHFEKGYAAQYDRLTLSPGFADALQALAEAAGAHVVQNLMSVAPCDPAKRSELQCVGEFLSKRGAALYRRPLTADETTVLSELFTKSRAEVSYAEALGTLVEAMVQSPQFLFRTELGNALSPAERVELTPFEIASALSFFLTGTAPDEQLMSKAATGALSEPSTRRSEAERLLASDAGKAGLQLFLVQWLGLTRFSGLTKEDTAFTPQLRSSMLQETTRFLDAAVTRGPGGFSFLFDSTTTRIDAALARLYGVTAPPTDWAEVSLDPKTRKGLLTQAAVLTNYSHGNTNRSPIPLGLLLRRKVLCTPLSDPPPDVVNLIPPAHLKTTREVSVFFRQNNPACQSCHRALDGATLPLQEQFDSLGRLSPENPNDADFGKGTLTNTDVDGEFRGATELAAKVAQSATAKTCFAAQLMSTSTGKDVTLPTSRSEASQRAVESISDRFVSSGDIRELVLTWVSSSDFIEREGSLLPQRSP